MSSSSLHSEAIVIHDANKVSVSFEAKAETPRSLDIDLFHKPEISGILIDFTGSTFKPESQRVEYAPFWMTESSLVNVLPIDTISVSC